MTERPDPRTCLAFDLDGPHDLCELHLGHAGPHRSGPYQWPQSPAERRPAAFPPPTWHEPPPLDLRPWIALGALVLAGLVLTVSLVASIAVP